MLKHIKNLCFTHSNHNHLGDIINIVQQVHCRSVLLPNLYCIFGRRCPCCGIDSGAMMRDILSLLDTSVKYAESQKFISLSPCWIKTHRPSPYDWVYAKARKLPQRAQHVVCQFDKRSKGNKVPTDINKYVKANMINIGDTELPCINKINIDLLEKFALIASAKEYIGIDSGLTHLALMTNTPITVIHPRSWQASRFYPKSNQLRFCTA